MGTEDDRAASALDDLLQRAVKQGYLDPMAGRAARSGVDRLRGFLANAGGEGWPGPKEDTAATGAGAQAAPTIAAEDPEAETVAGAAADVEAGAPGTTRIPVALRGGRRAELFLPERFDRLDAERIASVLHALALDDDPGAAADPLRKPGS
ncbi:hypothetical protein NUM3379_07980 [Kineococcus sp. NUM-3379]